MTINFELLKISRINSQKTVLYISSHEEAKKHQIQTVGNLIQKVPLGTPPQEVVTLLPHNCVTLTNLFISSYRGATVIGFWQYRSPQVTSLGLFYISSYGEATEAAFIHANVQVVISFLLQIFYDNKIQQILQERQMLCGSWPTCRLLYLYKNQAN